MLTLVAVALAIAGRPAAARDFGDRSGVFLSADRLFGAATTKTTRPSAGDLRQSSFGLFLATPSTVYQIPRLAVDFVPTNGLTLGAALGLSIATADRDDGLDSVQAPTVYGFLVQPRVGYARALSARLGLWLRGGFTYFRQTAEAEVVIVNRTVESKATSWGISMNFEPGVVVFLAPGFGLQVGLLADLPLTGSQEITRASVSGGGAVTETTTSTDESVRNIGVAVGLVGAF